MSTVLAQNPAAAGGEGVGLSITVSSEHDNDIKESDCTEPLTTAPSPTFIPPSVDPSPIPFEVDEDDEHAQTPAPVSSIMREPSSPLHPSPRPPQAHVDALEERVRDLEEKLSTLSMLLLQQNQRLSPQRKSPPSSPDSMSHSYDSSSLSPPTTPFRSLASFATIPSSNVPVLESPTPVMSTSSRRYRSDRGNNKSGKTNGDNILSGFSLPYEHRSPRQQTKKLPRRGLSKNLSYHILHSNDSELDFRNASGRNSSDEDDRGSSTTDHQTDDSFERACHVPSLDSLPGSSRTSPILSSDPVVARVLSPEQTSKPQESLEMSSSSSVEKKTLSPPPLTSPSQSAHSNAESVSKIKRRNRSNSFPIINMRNRSSSITSNNTSRISMSSKNNTAINNNNSMSEISNSGDTKHKKKKSNIKSKWLDYLNSVQESNYDTDKQMEEFVKVPSRVEALLSFGFWISVDSFLYTLTMLPLRSFYSIFLLTIWVYNKIVGRKASGIPQFHRHNTYHLIQMSIIYIIYATVLKPIDISIMYHMIRNQSMVKLYLLIAMVEVFDRLMCSLGQDCFDSLYWNTTRRPRSSRMVVAILLVLVYTGLHSFLLFVHVATLNVAMNSNDQALLSLLIGGNFAEIKSTVFKKYNKATLFKITASDICERFKLALFLFLVLMLNASQGMDQKMYYNYLSMCGVVVGGEWLSDWLKHSFITKFNFIASGVYSEYSLLLAGDVSGFGHEGGENLDKSHAVVKRLGLAQIPLVCVMAKYLKECYKYQTYTYQPQKWMLVVGTLSVWLLLLVTKLSLASVLQSMCKNKLETAPEFSKNNTTVAKKKNQ